ncbi:hypothetical protein GCM10029964_091620 [Kibdelosporangium lantanae]
MRIVAETGKSVARDVGISAYTLHNWVRAERRQTDGEPSQDGAVTESEHDELDRYTSRMRRHDRPANSSASGRVSHGVEPLPGPP